MKLKIILLNSLLILALKATHLPERKAFSLGIADLFNSVFASPVEEQSTDDMNFMNMGANKKEEQLPPISDVRHAAPEDDVFIKGAFGDISSTNINVEKFIETLERIECLKYNGDLKDPKNILCDTPFIKNAFRPLGKTNTNNEDFFNYLQQNVYHPLAYSATRKDTLLSMIEESMHMNPKNSLFYGQQVESTYPKFEESILRLFAEIADKTNTMDENHEVVASLIMKTLKRFHMYWNYLRHNNQFDKMKIHTKDVLRTLIKSVLARRDFLDVTSKTLLETLTRSYFKFIRAHKTIDVLKQSGPEIIANQLLNRYKAVAEMIQKSEYNSIILVKEIANLLSVMQVYHILSYKKGLKDHDIFSNFNFKIIEEIKKLFDGYMLLNSEDYSDLQKKQLKHFTVITLLKFKHNTFIMFQYHGLGQYVNMPQMNYLRSPFAIKIYYEMLDNMLLIPKTCISATLLKNCVLEETTKNLRYIVLKYNVKRSTYGWYFLNQLNGMMKSLYSKANEQTWESFEAFKTFYYSNLFSVMYNYKKLFGVNEMDSVALLESNLGALIGNRKRLFLTDPVQYGLIDTLDKELYNEFLVIKSDYNNFAPVENNSMVLAFLNDRVNKFLQNFLKEHESDASEKFKTKVIEVCKQEVMSWYRSHASTPEFNDDNTIRPNEVSYNYGNIDEYKSLLDPQNEAQLPPIDDYVNTIKENSHSRDHLKVEDKIVQNKSHHSRSKVDKSLVDQNDPEISLNQSVLNEKKQQEIESLNSSENFTPLVENTNDQSKAISNGGVVGLDSSEDIVKVPNIENNILNEEKRELRENKTSKNELEKSEKNLEKSEKSERKLSSFRPKAEENENQKFREKSFLPTSENTRLNDRLQNKVNHSLRGAI